MEKRDFQYYFLYETYVQSILEKFMTKHVTQKKVVPGLLYTKLLHFLHFDSLQRRNASQ